MGESKPIALDICCRKGGATRGLQRAGYYVIGVDVEDQPGYIGDAFWQVDGLKLLDLLVHSGGWLDDPWFGRYRPSIVWQSWPCQDGSTMTARNRAKGIPDRHEQFIPRARELSNDLGIPWVIEQPASSRKGLIRKDLVLCMDMFRGDMPPPWVQKHRAFEFGCWPDLREFGRSESLPAQLPHPGGWSHHDGYVRGWRHGVERTGAEAPYVAAYGNGGGKAKAWEVAHAMQIDWMLNPAQTERENAFDLYEAIPPAYAEYIGRELMVAL